MRVTTIGFLQPIPILHNKKYIKNVKNTYIWRKSVAMCDKNKFKKPCFHSTIVGTWKFRRTRIVHEGGGVELPLKKSIRMKIILTFLVLATTKTNVRNKIILFELRIGKWKPYGWSYGENRRRLKIKNGSVNIKMIRLAFRRLITSM